MNKLKDQQSHIRNNHDTVIKNESNTESLNLLPSSFNFDLNLSKETMQFVSQFAESRFNSLTYDDRNETNHQVQTNQAAAQAQLTAYSNENPEIMLNAGNAVNTSFENPNSARHTNSDFETTSNTSANTNKSNNPLLSCSTYNNEESEDETNWESLL